MLDWRRLPDGKSVACGSETNEVFVYNKNFSTPLATVSFDKPDVEKFLERKRLGNHFVSALCWSDESALISQTAKD